MATFLVETSVSDGGTYEMPYNGYILIGANGGTVTVSISIDGTNFAFDTTISDTKVKGLENKIPQGATLTFSGAACKIIAYG